MASAPLSATEVQMLELQKKRALIEGLPADVERLTEVQTKRIKLIDGSNIINKTNFVYSVCVLLFIRCCSHGWMVL